MTIVINTAEAVAPNWQAKGADRVAQNIRNLLTLSRNEVAYNRTLGMDASILDRPADEAAALYAAEVVRLVASSEPRATVVSVERVGMTEDGQLDFEVVIEIVD